MPNSKTPHSPTLTLCAEKSKVSVRRPYRDNGACEGGRGVRVRLRCSNLEVVCRGQGVVFIEVVSDLAVTDLERASRQVNPWRKLLSLQPVRGGCAPRGVATGGSADVARRRRGRAGRQHQPLSLRRHRQCRVPQRSVGFLFFLSPP